MTNDVINGAEDKLKKSLDALKKDYGTLRAGRAAPSLLDKVMVDYYGTSTPVNQIANVTVPEPRMLMIKPYDKGSLKEIERAIQKSDLGLTPNSDGIAIRLARRNAAKNLSKLSTRRLKNAKLQCAIFAATPTNQSKSLRRARKLPKTTAKTRRIKCKNFWINISSWLTQRRRLKKRKSWKFDE